MHMTIEYEQGNPRRDPEVLGQLLTLAWGDKKEGCDESSASPKFISHLNTLQAATRVFISTPISNSGYTNRAQNVLKPEWLDLFTLMFHCYFDQLRADVMQDTCSDPLVDSLLLLCDCTELDAISQAPGYDVMIRFIRRVTESERVISSGASRGNSSFLNQLVFFWNMEKQWRLDLYTDSLMPWSLQSIKEGSLYTPTPATKQARIRPGLVLHAYQSENLLTFPDMPWFGASHDGYPRYSSLTSYVSARWSPSFTPYDNAALWQAALTFGALEAITDLNIPEALLLEKRPDGSVVFTCRNIGVLVYHWIIHVFWNKNEGRRKHSLETLLRAERALAIECAITGREIFNGLSQFPQNDVDDVICTVFLLLRAFRTPVSQSFRNDVSYNRYISNNGKNRVVDIFIQRMVDGGWCPSFRHSDRLGAPPYWWYASSFKPFIRHHQSEHIRCSEDRCGAHSIDETTYKTLHVTPECSCPFLSPSIDSLRRTLRSDHIPVISLADGALAVHSASGVLPYVAISHVWVDGLGSSSEMGLPTCQIERIHGYVCELLEPTRIPAFWIDGLCIPKEKALRDKAIIMMRQTYEDAAKVLVFDSSIRTLCSSANPIEEIAFRIGASMWMQRVWTLQEALLARELYFEFSDCIVSATTLLRALCQRQNMDYGIDWITTADIVGNSTQTPAVLSTGKRPTFIDIMELLFYRSTSKSRDEPLAIAGLLNVDPAKIISQPDLESRIRTLFLEVGTLPRDLIFGKYKRMKTPGFRWCPIALTSIGHLDWNSPEALCSPDGLTTKTEILVLRLPRIDVFEGMDTRVYVHVSGIGAYYHLQTLLDSLPKDRQYSFNALLISINGLSPDPMGTATLVVAVNIPAIQDRQDAQITGSSTLPCEYVMRSWLDGNGETRDPSMEGHPMMEGRLVWAKVTVM